MSIRVRFAPSPTGHIHVGNVRTALFNYLFARNTGGTFLLRIEDTDLERSSLASEELIYEDLRWLGFDWDEGPSKGGDFGPYRQTERFDIYKEYSDRLLAEGKAYKCFCSREELDAQRETAAANNETFCYPGTCRNLSAEEVARREAAGEKGAIRFRVDKEIVAVSDVVKGDIDFQTNMFGDFIIVRQDGAPIYNYVCVIDDALMQITHVIRGDDHLSNTPKQVLIYQALGFETPKFAHIPMILGADRSKLSKRHGNTSVLQFREEGYLPEALFNFMALLSWSDEQEREILERDELIRVFSLDRVTSSAAVFDFDKLKWMNGNYIRACEAERLADLCAPYIVAAGLCDEAFIANNRERYVAMVQSVKEKFEILKDVTGQIDLFFTQDVPDAEALEVLAIETSRAVLEAFKTKIAGNEYLEKEQYKALVKEIQAETGAKGKALFMVLRIGMSGRMKGPELDAMASLIPVAELTARIDAVLAKMENN